MTIKAFGNRCGTWNRVHTTRITGAGSILNLGLVAIFSAVTTGIIISIPLIAYAVSQYDKDGFTIFPTKSSDYMSGYRAGVIQADKDVQKFNDNKLSGIDANQDKIKCPTDSFNADFCSGYKDGYSDEAMGQLE